MKVRPLVLLSFLGCSCIPFTIKEFPIQTSTAIYDYGDFMLFSDSVIFSYHSEYNAEKRERISECIWKASSAADIDPYLLLGLFALESGFDSSVVSSKGAKGIAQFMPRTWKWISEEIGMTYDIVSYDGGIYASAYYLKKLIVESKGDIEKALIAYSGYKTENEKALKYVETVMRFTNHDRNYTR